MQNILEFESRNLPNANKNHSLLMENRIESLKALAALLLKEVEYLANTSKVKIPKNGNESINLSTELERFEVELIRDALIRAGGHQRNAAKLLGTKVTTLNAKIKRYGIDSIKLLGKI